MLRSLNILNFAVVKQLQIEFEPGFNVLTGETGAGKSIVIDSLGLVLGERASTELIRSGEQKAYVEALFCIPEYIEIEQFFHENGLVLNSNEILIRREISREGRGRNFVNDQLVTVSFLKLLRPYLLDIHGQGDQYSLLNPITHCKMLDNFGNLSLEVDALKKKYLKWHKAQQELNFLKQEEAERLRQLDILNFQFSEIESANIDNPNEDLELEPLRRKLANSERISALTSDCYQLLYENRDALLTNLGHVMRKFDELVSLDPELKEQSEAIQSVFYTVEDIALSLRKYAEQLELLPDQLKQVDDRLLELTKIKRKYGPTLSKVLNTHKNIQEQLSKLNVSEEYIQELQQTVADTATIYIQQAELLSNQRQHIALKFEKFLMNELRYLAMENTRVKVGIKKIDVSSTSCWRSDGIDEIEFLMSSNPGEELKDLVKTASGGEISRFMLALKTITAPTGFPRTMIFDEIDVGIGGHAAEKIGQRLKKIGSHQQILCVTHLAQIARFAEVHYVVSKNIVGKRTETFVKCMNESERVEELARMIAGNSLSNVAKQTAREMLKNSDSQTLDKGKKEQGKRANN